jgi:hypothetical protein
MKFVIPAKAGIHNKINSKLIHELQQTMEIT